MPRRNVVIAGGGFAAWCLARALDRELERADTFDATVVCPAACAPLSPWTHDVLAGRLHAEQAVVPWRDALRHVRVLLGRATQLGASAQSVAIEGPGVQTGCDPGSLEFDELVLATGRGAALRSGQSAADRSLPLRNPSHAVALRNRLLEALAAASGEDSARRRKVLLTVAVIGSDEAAVAAAVDTLFVLRKSAPLFPRVQSDDPRVILVCPSQLCPTWGQHGAALISAHLGRHGVEVRSGSRIVEEAEDHLVLESQDGHQERIEVRTIVSLEPAAVSPLLGFPGAPVQDGLVRIDEMLRVIGMQQVHAIGSCAAHPTAQPTPAVIVRHARWLASAIARRAKGQPPTALAGAPAIDAVSLGAGTGIARIGSRIFTGNAAGWMARRTVRSAVPGIGRRLSLAAWSWLEPLGVQQLVSRSGANAGASRPLYLTPPPPPMR